MSIAYIIYNGVLINDVMVNNIEEEARFDETGVDPVWQEITVDVEGVAVTTRAVDTDDPNKLNPRIITASDAIHNWLGARLHDTLDKAAKPSTDAFLTGASHKGGPTNAGNSAATVPSATITTDMSLEEIKERLTTPRRDFIFQQDNFIIDIRSSDPLSRNVITSEEATSRVDVDNGPRTKVRLGNFMYGMGVKVAFTLRAAVIPCRQARNRWATQSSSDYVSSNVLNHRIWVADEIDGATLETKRIWNGRLTLLNREFHAHKFRYLCLPWIAPGFQRVGVSFNESPDNRVLDYRFIDQENFVNPPPPARNWSGHVNASSPIVGGAVVELGRLSGCRPRRKCRRATFFTSRIESLTESCT